MSQILLEDLKVQWVPQVLEANEAHKELKAFEGNADQLVSVDQ